MPQPLDPALNRPRFLTHSAPARAASSVAGFPSITRAQATEEPIKVALLNEARRLLEMGLRCMGLQGEELAGLKKGDERKAASAALIRKPTAVPTAWIARELELGHAGRASHCVRDARSELLRKLERCR